MEKAIQEYRQLTGSEPKNLVVVGDKTGRRLAEQFASLCGDGLKYDSNVREMEFIKVKRTADGYSVRLIDVHRKADGHYSGVNLDVGHVLLEEIGPAIAGLNIGDSATYCLKGTNVSEIIRKRKSYFHGQEQPTAQGKVDRVLSGQNLTESQLIRNHAFEIKGNDGDGYISDVIIKNVKGIHWRPAASIAKIASRYDCNVLIKKNGIAVDAKSVLSIASLEALKDTNLIIESEGLDAKKCLEELVSLFENKFGEE